MVNLFAFCEILALPLVTFGLVGKALLPILCAKAAEFKKDIMTKLVNIFFNIVII